MLVFGATVHSASTVLAGFMSGFALGSLLGWKWSRKTTNPLRLYGLLELGIAAAAAVFPLCVDLILAIVEKSALPIGPLRMTLAFAALLPATVLMGATFPILSQHYAGRGDGREVANLYAANLAGACLGALVNAFLLLAFLGLSGSHWLAVLVNLAAGLAALRLSSSEVYAHLQPQSSAPAGWPSAAVFVSGLCGMALEIVWIRLLVPSFNNSAYGFAAVLFVFLLSLGAGSWLSGRMRTGSLALLGALQGLAALFAYVGYLTFELSQVWQSRYADTTNLGVSPFVLVPLVEALVVLGPLAVIQGMALPTAVRLAAPSGGSGSAVGRLYFWNTMGAIAGALATGFWWIPAYNVQNSLLLILAISLTSGTILIAAGTPQRKTRWLVAAAAVLALILARAGLRGRYLPSEMLMEWATRFPDMAPKLLSYTEDLEGSVAVQERGGTRMLVINGVGVTGYTNATKMLAHIPLLLHPEPKRVLIICFGMGTTFRSTLSHPVQVEMVELAGSVFKAFPLFYRDARRWSEEPRARLFVNDGRNHLLRAREGYDVILVDPSPPLYAAGTANLYSRQFFELARRKLKPGGLLAVWLPEYPETEFKMVLKSFVSAMPRTQMWLGTVPHNGLVMLGSEQPIAVDRERIRKNLADPLVRRDLLELNPEFATEAAFWRLYLGPGERFARYLAESPEVTDDFPRIEYPYFRSKTRKYYRHPELFDWPALASPLN